MDGSKFKWFFVSFCNAKQFSEKYLCSKSLFWAFEHLAKKTFWHLRKIKENIFQWKTFFRETQIKIVHFMPYLTCFYSVLHLNTLLKMLKEFTVFDIFSKTYFFTSFTHTFHLFFLSNHFCIQKNLFHVKHSSTLVIGKHHQLFPPFTMDMQSLVIGSKFVLLPPTWYSEWIHEGGDTVNFRGLLPIQN